MSRFRAWGWETSVFRIATTVALLHALDDAFFNRQPGVDLDQHALAAAISLVAGIGAILAFPRLRPGFRAAISFAFGVLAIVNGVLHVVHISKDGPAHSDLTGVAAVVAGAALVALGVLIPFLHRGEGAVTSRRRWAYRALAIVAGLIGVFTFLFPVSSAIVQTHKFREPIGEPPSAAYRPVTFTASDGLRLSGWYVPSKNRAAVILVHGGGGDRTGATRHAELLVRHGYGVLLYDSRGRGESEGSPVGYAWGWRNDVAGALAFLGGQSDVDDSRIGALGLSRGADALIGVAAERREIAAVVADGATVSSFADYRNVRGLDELAPSAWPMFLAVRILSGASPGEPLKESVADISPTPLLLIATGGSLPDEIPINRIYAEAAREPVEHWELPQVNHTAAIRERPEEYERRVVGFFDEALGRGNP